MINSNVMSQIDIFEATSCKPEYVAAVNRLLLQLCSSPCEMSAEQLQNLVNEPNSRLLLLTVDGEVMGMCTVGFYTSPTGRKAWIEDVVVDAQCRGLHLGERLVASLSARASTRSCLPRDHRAWLLTDSIRRWGSNARRQTCI